MGLRETLIGSQLWWNWEVDTTRYKGWKQLLKDLNAHHVKVMTYCNPCLAPVRMFSNLTYNKGYDICTALYCDIWQYTENLPHFLLNILPAFTVA